MSNVTPNPAPNIVVKSLEMIGIFPFYEALKNKDFPWQKKQQLMGFHRMVIATTTPTNIVDVELNIHYDMYIYIYIDIDR